MRKGRKQSPETVRKRVETIRRNRALRELQLAAAGNKPGNGTLSRIMEARDALLEEMRIKQAQVELLDRIIGMEGTTDA